MPEKRPPDPRDYFAAERTYLAWIRTGLALMGLGFLLARLALGNQLPSMAGDLAGVGPDPSRYFGVALVMVGVLTTAAATVSHVRTVHGLNAGEPFVGRPTWVGILVAVLLAAVGTLMSVYLFRS